MKKYLLIAVLVILLLSILVAGTVFVFVRKMGKGESGQVEEDSSRQTKMVGDLPLDQKPYVSMVPTADGHWVYLNVARIDPGVEEVEYEIIYEMSPEEGRRLEQGVLGHGKPEDGTYSGKRLFGSESSGKYKYDQDVEGKSLVLRLRSENEVLKYETQWRFFQGVHQIDSADGKLTLSADFPKNDFWIVLKTAGLVNLPEKEIVAGPYGFFGSGGQTLENGRVEWTLEANQAPVKLLIWDEKTWETVEDLDVEDAVLTAGVDKAGVFILVADEPASE
jgi:hypothetical protein